MQTLQTVLAFLIVLGPLIAIHEFGHFWVARRLGVKVLTYSIGFGRGLIKWRDKQGTQYQIAAIPLGGFVRMADEREGEVAPEDLPRAFNRQPVWARMAIVAAGPLINLLLAVLLYWFLFLQHTDSDMLRTVVGKVQQNSPAAVAGLKAGDEITRIDDTRITGWESVTYALIDRMGETGQLVVTVKPGGTGAEQVHSVKLDRFLRESGADPFKTLGFEPMNIAPVLGKVMAGNPGERQGLKVGDKITKADGKPVDSWWELVSVVEAHPGKPFVAEVLRNGQPLNLTLTPESQSAGGKVVGKLGIGMDPPANMVRHLNYGVFDALKMALDKTAYQIRFTLEALGKMLRGMIGLDNLSGPITIAKVAGQAASIGWESLLGFMALLSVSLGVLNLLPIPVLDGGHLVYYAIEGVIGRPLSEKAQMLGLRIGIALMGGLMLLAIFNDLSRLFLKGNL